MFLDIGSNYGTYSIPSIELKIPSILVEPNPFICTALHRTFKKFQNVKIINKAIFSDPKEGGSVCLNIMPFLSGASSIKDDITKNSMTSTECFSLDVDVLSIDRLIYEVQTDLDFLILKLDVEGIELDLLRGGLIQKLRDNFSRFIIFLEYVPDVYSVESDLVEYRNYLCSLPSIILSDKNYNFSHGIERPYSSFGAILDDGISISDLYDINLFNTHMAYNELAAIKYADVVLFSDLIIANNFISQVS
jgi:FkbM family methyltransferase